LLVIVFTLEHSFGHQAGITALDALSRERAVTCSADKTYRLWKVVEESQLLFQGIHRLLSPCYHFSLRFVFIFCFVRGADMKAY
jgi:hypothetical protein